MGTLFGKKKSEKPAPAEDRDADALEALHEACERNCPAGFARLGFVGQDPLASGRLLRWEGERLFVEELQVIGGEIRFGVGDRLECYATLNDKILAFGSTVRTMATPQRLNDSTVVASMVLDPPTGVAFGNRRGAYRASIGVLGNEFAGDLWFLDRSNRDADEPAHAASSDTTFSTSLRAAAEMPSLYPLPSADQLAAYYGTPLPATQGDIEEPPTTLPAAAESETQADVTLRWRTLAPTDAIDWSSVLLQVRRRAPHARVRIADVSPNGVGVTMYGVAAMQLHRFERVALSTSIGEHEIRVVGAVRRCEDLTHQRCRVGLVLLHPGPKDLRADARRSLEDINLQVQRELLRRR
ncbi:MAG: hypothetical protein AAFX79_06940 [Planctomycetota bacterium]